MDADDTVNLDYRSSDVGRCGIKVLSMLTHRSEGKRFLKQTSPYTDGGTNRAINQLAEKGYIEEENYRWKLTKSGWDHLRTLADGVTPDTDVKFEPNLRDTRNGDTGYSPELLRILAVLRPDDPLSAEEITDELNEASERDIEISTPKNDSNDNNRNKFDKEYIEYWLEILEEHQQLIEKETKSESEEGSETRYVRKFIGSYFLSEADMWIATGNDNLHNIARESVSFAEFIETYLKKEPSKDLSSPEMALYGSIINTCLREGDMFSERITIVRSLPEESEDYERSYEYLKKIVESDAPKKLLDNLRSSPAEYVRLLEMILPDGEDIHPYLEDSSE